ncbi:MAG TPA: hypothetical protein VK936_04750 [Longimicrobiales bacterium]|nr:hypothetical protein [Longimicrobiales bacterium]
MKTMTVLRRAALLLTLATCTPTAARAQLANTMPAALGMGENYTAAARGYAAVAWNPANLGLPDGPSASAMLGATRLAGGLGPVTLSDLHRYQDETVPLDVRERWLADIRQAGGQTGGAGVDVGWAAFQVGRFAAQLSTSGRAVNDVSPGFAQLLLVGNADDAGNPLDIDLGGSVVDAEAYSTGAVSFAVPLPRPPGVTALAIGVTAKYTIGHALARTGGSTGQAGADPAGMELSFPLAYTPVVHDGNRYWVRSGGGFGVDVGAALRAGDLTVSAVVQNVVSTFEWDLDRLRYRPLELVFREDETETDTDWQPMTGAPAETRALVADATFRPSFAAGVAWRQSAALLVAADARLGSGDGMATRPPVHAGIGMEYRPVRWLPLQAGTAWVRTADERDGMQFAGGAGIQLGSFTISASGARRRAGPASETMFMVSLLAHTF